MQKSKVKENETEEVDDEDKDREETANGELDSLEAEKEMDVSILPREIGT